MSFWHIATLKSLVVKHSVNIGGHKTSVSLEEAFWRALREIAETRDMTLSSLLSEIDVTRETGNLSSNIRLYVLGYYRSTIPGEASSAAR